jgi:hypothetical protein
MATIIKPKETPAPMPITIPEPYTLQDEVERANKAYDFLMNGPKCPWAPKAKRIVHRVQNNQVLNK